MARKIAWNFVSISSTLLGRVRRNVDAGRERLLATAEDHDSDLERDLRFRQSARDSSSIIGISITFNGG